ncbi:MAG TPA: NAD(P)/FAD-dependent oxidoreductase [Nitrospiria bacterium]|nr:NAD(P)/FAD-dependent oxidoreductase [Nitrospiria bacterium]
MTTAVECDVLICGGGVGGLVLALLLGRGGADVRVLEQAPSLPMARRAENIQPNGLAVLDRLGLLQPLLKAGAWRNEQFEFVSIDPDGNGRSLCTIDYRDLPGSYPYTLLTTPAVIQPLLLDAVMACANVRCLWGMKVTGMEWEREVVCVTASGADGVPHRWRARMVVGADGVYSTVRRLAGLSASVHLYRDGYATAMIPRPAALGAGGRYAVGRGRIMALFPVSTSEVALLYMIRRDRWAAVRAGALETLKGDMHRILPMADESLLSLASWDQVGFMPCARVRASSWVGDRVALIGDAAHALNPHVAQGRNQAMEDAEVLAGVIAEGLRTNQLGQPVLARFDSARRPQVERLQRAADEMTLLWNNGGWPVDWLRERIFRTLARNRRLRSRMTALVGGLPVRPYSLVERFQAAGLLPDPRAGEAVRLESGSP